MSYIFGGTPFDGYKNGRRSLNMGGGGGGSQPTNTTTQTSNIPDWLRPQVEAAIGASTQQLFNVNQDNTITGLRPYVPYSANPSDYVAGFSPMQQQSFQSSANLQTPKQFGTASTLANQAGQGALGTASQATGFGELGSRYGAVGARIGEGGLGYGQAGYQAGLQGQNIGTTQGLGYGQAGYQAGLQGQNIGTNQGGLYGGMGAGYGMQAAQSGNQYAQQATNPNAVQSYMSPYQQAAIDVQKQEANRAFDIQTQQRNAAAVRSGAFGGSRQGIEQAEAQRNLNQQLQNIQATGNQAAYDRAIQSMQYGSGLNLQGLQAGMQGAQAGLAGVDRQLAGTAQGMQGAQTGLQGVNAALAGTAQGMQGAQTGIQGINAALAGTAQGIQGAQTGLQGVQGAQAAYNLANQSAQNLGQLGSQQLAAQQAIINQQNTLGAQQQARQQQITNQAIQDYANAQVYPQQQLGFYNAMIRGYATPTVTTSQYQASPNTVSQIAGLGATALGAYGASGGFKAKGGVIKSKGDGLDDIGMYLAMKGKK